jgi:hypothetical protein
MNDGSAISALAVFSGNLYAGGYYSPSTQIWRTDGIQWTAAMTDDFGGEAVSAVGSFAVWDGQLYATALQSGGIGVWRSPNGVQWSKVASIVTTSTIYNLGRTGLFASGEYLYLFVGLNTGLEAWRTADGTTWRLVGNAGLGEPGTLGIFGNRSMATFRGQMLVGTIYRTTLMTTTGGQIVQYLPETHNLPFVAGQ